LALAKYHQLISAKAAYHTATIPLAEANGNELNTPIN
jgi:hypothetical protein